MSAHGPAYWRSLLERAGATEAEGELPPAAERPPSSLSRRAFLQLAGASAALSGLGAGCFRSPLEKILAYVDRPPEVTPGVGTPYATSFELDGFGTGVVVESREGRPIKVEGNPRHPASLGAAGVFEQAALLDLYDPARARGVTRAGDAVTWQAFLDSFAPRPGSARGDDSRTRFLLEPTASPLLAELVAELAHARPGARVHYAAALHSRAPRDAAATAFGRALQALPDLSRAGVVLALDADLFGSGPFHLRFARDFADGRRVRARGDAMNRLYVAEPAPTVTGDAADHRLRRRADAVPALLAAVFCEVARTRGAYPQLVSALAPRAAGEPDARLVRALARDLATHPGEALVVAGERQPPVVHCVAYVLTALLGGLGTTLRFIESPLLEARGEAEGLAALAEDARAGGVSTLVIAGGNPVRDAPGDVDFAAALARVEHSVCLAPLAHETARRCEWHVAELHALESWGDARALDGTASLVQPLIAPLWGGHSRAELLAAFVDGAARSAYQRLRARWRAGADEARWEERLATGVVAESAAAPLAPAVRAGAVARAAASGWPEPPPQGAIEVAIRRDARVHDGRFADNPWLQELPDPITKLTWDCAAWVAPRTAARLGVATGDWLALRRGERAVEIPALVVPGQADDSLLLSLGYGREAGLPVAGGVGVDVSPLASTERPALATGVEVSALPGRARHDFALTQSHWRLEGRDVVRELSLADLGEPRKGTGPLASLYEPPEPPGPQWGMTIDQTLCTGCSACVVACQAENNIPVVGRDGVRHSREMQWLRVDRYLLGSEEDPSTRNQLMLCQHCEMAPCEYVCPVEATVHSRDGLNEMIYNRCVGTRFCSNNCPYKVRRFNWFEFNGNVPEARRMQFNPDVTVRARGVMEKCTYCVQRIRRAGIRAGNQHRALEDGEVVTACQQACPTRAISFGSVSDPESQTSRDRRAPHAYAVLEEVGTRPRTRYLARLRNPNPDLEGGA